MKLFEYIKLIQKNIDNIDNYAQNPFLTKNFFEKSIKERISTTSVWIEKNNNTK